VLTPSITSERPWVHGLGLATLPESRRPGSLSGIARLMSALIVEFRARRAARRLMELDDYMLRDMGLSRTDIGRVVRGGRDSL
jgi:uncharacterized protein YjiS (DUF1127 family)